METKECSRCKLDLPVNQFQLRFSYGEARRTECTSCKRAYDRARNALLRANPKPVVIRATASEEVACNVEARAWRGPVNREAVLRWAA